VHGSPISKTSDFTKAANMSKLRILIVGDFMWPWYQEVCANVLENLGCEVVRFGWFDDFWRWQEGSSEPFYLSLMHRIQYRLHIGPTVWQVSRRLKRQSVAFQPDIIWFYNVQLINRNVVKSIKKDLPNAICVQYANDNPFSSSAKLGLWRNYLSSIPLFDVHFSYRLNNIADYQRWGARSIHMLRSYFIPEEDYPLTQDSIPEHFKCDVVFAGHYEDDGRVEMLEAICREGYRLNLFGGGWDAALPKLNADSPLHAKYPIRPVTKADYRYAICGAKVALCFLSKLNHDTYTRRSFQIPAMEVAMLSQYTDDLANLYRSDKEAVFFRDKHELLDKLAQLLGDNVWRQSVAKAGYDKVYATGHDVTSRMKAWLEDLRKFRS
jgi:spore maturation protein CgeB